MGLMHGPSESWHARMQPALDAAAPSNTVLAHGCFDLLHLGHIRHLQEARKLGDRLIVAVTDDPHVRKGAGRPVFTTEERLEALRALECVDEAFACNNGVEAIEAVAPAVYVKGSDYNGKDDEALKQEIAAVEVRGGRYHATVSPALWSSSRLINSERLPENVLAYLDSARSRGFLERILAAFDRADKLRIAFVGEIIKDEYVYVSPIGKPSKESILATVQNDVEVFWGGVHAASEHAQWKNVWVVTLLRHITKTRFIDKDTTRKLFETYSSTQIELTDDQRGRFRAELIRVVREADAVIVLDFGHGLMAGPDRLIAQTAKFFAVNAQTNAGNYGFNLITRYQHADYVCVDDPEARLATGLQSEPVAEVISALTERINSPCVTVTHGRHGTTSFDRRLDGERMVSVPAFALGGVDTIGAGDAFLAVAAPLLAAGLGLEEATFAGNVAGAVKVGIVGHRACVEREQLVQSITSLLK